MKSIQNLIIPRYKTPLLVVNGICLIMVIYLLYKHYFQNDGKGIDEYLLALSMFSFTSFFGAMSSIVELKTRKLLWLILGLIYVIISAIYLEYKILVGQNLLKLILIASSIPLVLFCALIIFIKKQKIYGVILQILFIFSFIASILPICLFALSIFGFIFTIFYKT